MPITVLILILLFFFQRQGTKIIGTFFGPIMMVWFITIAILGVSNIIDRPEIMKAVNPIHAFTFFGANGLPGFIIL